MAMTNARVVRRSNSLLNYHQDFSYHENMRGGGLIKSIIFTLILIILNVFLYFSLSRNVLRKFLPSSGQGPSRKKMESGSYRIGLVAYPDDDSDPIRVVVSGKQDPGYLDTAKMISECAFCIALERDKLAEGGVLTTAAAFGMHVIERLRKKGISFEVVDSF